MKTSYIQLILFVIVFFVGALNDSPNSFIAALIFVGVMLLYAKIEELK